MFWCKKGIGRSYRITFNLVAGRALPRVTRVKKMYLYDHMYTSICIKFWRAFRRDSGRASCVHDQSLRRAFYLYDQTLRIWVIINIAILIKQNNFFSLVNCLNFNRKIQLKIILIKFCMHVIRNGHFLSTSMVRNRNVPEWNVR